MLVLLVSAALGADASPKIVNGALEEGFPAVVALGAQFGENTITACSGALITPRIVLSAAHCADGIAIELVVAAGKAFFGAEAADPDLALAFSGAVIHPGYVPLRNGVGATLGENDVSVLILAEDAPIAPLDLNLAPLGPEVVGAALTSVGFGYTSAEGGDGGTKRSVGLTLDELDPVYLISRDRVSEGEGQICSGDSGGPQMVQEADGRFVIWGVHSWGDAACRRESGSTRTDVVADFLLGEIEAVHGTTDLCEAAGRYDDGACQTFCPAPDPDCAEPAAAIGDYTGGGCAAAAGRAGLGAVGLALLSLVGRRRGGPSPRRC